MSFDDKLNKEAKALSDAVFAHGKKENVFASMDIPKDRATELSKVIIGIIRMNPKTPSESLNRILALNEKLFTRKEIVLIASCIAASLTGSGGVEIHVIPNKEGKP